MMDLSTVMVLYVALALVAAVAWPLSREADLVPLAVHTRAGTIRFSHGNVSRYLAASTTCIVLQ